MKETNGPTRTALASDLLQKLNRTERPKSRDHDIRSSRMSRDTGSIRSAPGFTPLPATVPDHDLVDERRTLRFWRRSRRLHLRRYHQSPVPSSSSSSSSWLSIDPERAVQRVKVLKALEEVLMWGRS